VTIGLCGQNPLQRVFGQKKIEVFFFGPGSIEKALLRGCDGVHLTKAQSVKSAGAKPPQERARR
jgi:hypothetical protein